MSKEARPLSKRQDAFGCDRPARTRARRTRGSIEGHSHVPLDTLSPRRPKPTTPLAFHGHAALRERPRATSVRYFRTGQLHDGRRGTCDRPRPNRARFPTKPTSGRAAKARVGGAVCAPRGVASPLLRACRAWMQSSALVLHWKRRMCRTTTTTSSSSRYPHHLALCPHHTNARSPRDLQIYGLHFGAASIIHHHSFPPCRVPTSSSVTVLVYSQ